MTRLSWQKLVYSEGMTALSWAKCANNGQAMTELSWADVNWVKNMLNAAMSWWA